MLSDGNIREIFFDMLCGIWDDGILATAAMSVTRDQNGEFPLSYTSQSVKVQRDACTQKQISQPGYTTKDVRIMVLQSGVAVPPNTDSRISHRDEMFVVMDIDEDPCAVYWDLRARLVSG
jgi:hypothetical protein